MKISKIFRKAARIVSSAGVRPVNGTNNLYRKKFACNAIQVAQNLTEITSGSSDARRYFEDLFDVLVEESRQRISGEYQCVGIFGDDERQENQDCRVTALLLAAEVAESEGL
jgi:hypothetical protein